MRKASLIVLLAAFFSTPIGAEAGAMQDLGASDTIEMAGLEADSEDVASPEAIVLAAYDAIARAPGEAYDWDRFRSLFLPEARLVPNTEQLQGSFDVLSPEEFIEWIDAVSVTPGSENDKGFQEEQISAEVERYGDIAHVFSTYQKHFWGSDEILGHGINSFQLVHDGDRWWIAGIVWDEETGAGPIPAEYLPE